MAGFIAAFLCVRRFGEQLAQIIVNAGVGGHGGAHIDADRGGVDELDMRDPLGADIPNVRWQSSAADVRLQCGDQAFQHHGGFAGTGHAGHHRQPPFRNVHLQRLHRVDRRGGQMDHAVGKHRFGISARAQAGIRFAGQERPDLGGRVVLDSGNRALGKDVPALGSRLRPHLHDPIRLFQDLGIVIHQNHRVAVGDQIVHHTSQPHNVGGMQPDARLVQHIQHAGGAVAHRARQLHPLPFAGGQGGC